MPKDTSLYFRRNTLLAHVELRRANRSSACYQTHTHDEFSVGVIDAGSATYRNRQYQKVVRRGMTVMINPGDAHSCNPDAGEQWSYRMLFIDACWIDSLQANLPHLVGYDYAPLLPPHNDTIACYRQFAALFETLELEKNPLAADERLIQFLMRYCLDHRGRWPSPESALNPLKIAREMIMDQLTDQVTLAAIADVAGMNPFQLIRSFKLAYGQTPHAFQLDQRINRAKKLLKLGTPIVEVAHQLGFADQSHFQRHFKNRHAVTPKNYQRDLQT